MSGYVVTKTGEWVLDESLDTQGINGLGDFQRTDTPLVIRTSDGTPTGVQTSDGVKLPLITDLVAAIGARAPTTNYFRVRFNEVSGTGVRWASHLGEGELTLAGTEGSRWANSGWITPSGDDVFVATDAGNLRNAMEAAMTLDTTINPGGVLVLGTCYFPLLITGNGRFLAYRPLGASGGWAVGYNVGAAVNLQALHSPIGGSSVTAQYDVTDFVGTTIRFAAHIHPAGLQETLIVNGATHESATAVISGPFVDSSTAGYPTLLCQANAGATASLQMNSGGNNFQLRDLIIVGLPSSGVASVPAIAREYADTPTMMPLTVVAL